MKRILAAMRSASILLLFSILAFGEDPPLRGVDSLESPIAPNLIGVSRDSARTGIIPLLGQADWLGEDPTSTFGTRGAFQLPAVASLYYFRPPGVTTAMDAAGVPAGFSSSRSPDGLSGTAAFMIQPAVSPKQSGDEGFQWRPALRQSMTFLLIQHAFRFGTEQNTKAEIAGPFFADWYNSMLGVRGWRDGDPFYVNYVGHPMQGAVTGYIQVQNDPSGKRLIFNDPGYWKSRSKAMAWAAVYSTQFELGPISEASLGNVGRTVNPRNGRTGAGAVDLVVSPTVGTAWLVGEDMMDRYVIRHLETKTQNRVFRMFIRGVLNPDRAMANMIAGKVPWHRDTRKGIWRRQGEVKSENPGRDSQVALDRSSGQGFRTTAP